MIVAGFGFRASASAASLRSAFELATVGHDVGMLATIVDKADAPCLRALADALSLPIQPICAGDLAGARTISQSPHSLAAFATGSVAEAAALIAAGPGAQLVSARHVSQDRKATCAIAVEGPS